MLARMGLSDVVGNIERLTADGGYDRLEVCEAASRVGAKVVILPEVLTGCRILNRMFELGKPASAAV